MQRTPIPGTLAAAKGGLVTLLFLFGCSDPQLCIALTNTPTGTVQLRIRASIEGGSDQEKVSGTDQFIDGAQTKVCVALPSSAKSDAAIKIDALDSGGCTLASASVADSPPDGLFRRYYYSKSFIPSEKVSPDGWCTLEFPKELTPGLSGIQAIWGSSSQNVWIIDYSGHLLHWDGQNWSLAAEDGPGAVYGMWGNPTSELWTVGLGPTNEGEIGHFVHDRWESRRPTGRLHDIWGSGSSELWAVGETAGQWQIQRRTGAGEWVSMLGPLIPPKPLYQVWGRGRSDIWMVGGSLTILHADDSGAVTPSLIDPAVTEVDLYGVWAGAPDDVWAVGGNGMILHKAGKKDWAPPADYTTVGSTLRSVWGSSPSQIWAVGESGTILHWAGTRWTPVKSGTTQSLYRVWGTETGEVWAVGSQGTVLHYSGRSS